MNERKGNEKHYDLVKRTRRKHRVCFMVFMLAIVTFSTFIFFSDKKKNISLIDEKQEKETTHIMQEASDEERGEQSQEYIIVEDDVPAKILAQEGRYSANEIAEILDASEDVYDLTQIRVGRTFNFYFTQENTSDMSAYKFTYEPNTEEIITVEKDSDGAFQAVLNAIEYRVENEVANLTLDNSLYADALNADISEPTVIALGNAFAYSIDFSREIQPGDTINFVYEKRRRDDVVATDGNMLAAVLTQNPESQDEEVYHAYYFDIDLDDEKSGLYYDDEGRELRRQFLRAPMDFFRITSGFTGQRLHPITNTVMTHYQIDYAAPTGTPAFTTADGVVMSAGFETGWGNIVRVRHGDGYTTHYAHLSGFAKNIKSGTQIEQGQTVGYVGSTGWSTGPHLDYGMRKNGQPINPLTLKLPPGEKLPREDLERFEKQKNLYSEILKDN